MLETKNYNYCSRCGSALTEFRKDYWNEETGERLTGKHCVNQECPLNQKEEEESWRISLILKTIIVFGIIYLTSLVATLGVLTAIKIV